jgi:hypothetical protein
VRGRVREICLRQWAQQVKRGSGGVGRFLERTGRRRAATLEGRSAGTLLWSAEYCGPPTLSTVHVSSVREISVNFRGALGPRRASSGPGMRYLVSDSVTATVRNGSVSRNVPIVATRARPHGPLAGRGGPTPGSGPGRGRIDV